MRYLLGIALLSAWIGFLAGSITGLITSLVERNAPPYLFAAYEDPLPVRYVGPNEEPPPGPTISPVAILPASSSSLSSLVALSALTNLEPQFLLVSTDHNLIAHRGVR